MSLETVLLRKEYIDKLEKSFDPDFSHISDFDLIIRLCMNSKLAYHDEVMAGWRVHERSETHKNHQYFLKEKNRWIKKYLHSEKFKEFRREIKTLEIENKIMNQYYNAFDQEDYWALLLEGLFDTRLNIKYKLMMIPALGKLALLLKNYQYQRKWFSKRKSL